MQKALWYAVQTVQNHEEKVKKKIQMLIENNEYYKNLILQAEVPVEEKIVVKNGDKKIKTQKLIPGYVFVKMVMTPETLHTIRTIAGVKNFVGSGTEPIPISSSEIKQLGIRDTAFAVPFVEGDTVIVSQGPFENFIGVVKSIDKEKGKIRVELQMFGRNITIDFDVDQIKKLE